MGNEQSAIEAQRAARASHSSSGSTAASNDGAAALRGLKGAKSNDKAKLGHDVSNSPQASGDELTAKPGMFIQPSNAIFSERYRGVKVLGKGSFGEVILCSDRITHQQCAVKVISKKQVKQTSDKESLLREVELLKQLDHPNIMKLFEFFEDSGYFYLVGEVYTGGELFDEIVNRKRFSEGDAARIVKQVLSGITYMHRNKIVHRDLKPENLLLESKKKDANIRIIDFGLSTHFEAAKKMKDKIGTAYYIAPEVLRGVYDEKCDVWSIGVILYILLSGSPPFNGENEYDILKKVERGKFSFELPQWKKISEDAKDLIKRMLTYVPSMRISSMGALDHAWIRHTCDTEKVDLPSLEATISNIRQFQSTQKLAQAALLYMGSKLTTNEETKELTEIFTQMDKNGDGQLDRGELIEGYKELLKLKGQDCNKIDNAALENELDQILESIDFDKNGYLEYSEFVTVAMDRKTLLSTERLQKAFKMFDEDSSGKISSQELAKVFGVTDLNSEMWNQVLQEVDKNKDGEIDFDEFQHMLMRLCG